MRIGRRTLRLISLCLIQVLTLYYLTRYRIAVVQWLTLGAGIVAVLVVLTLFPYEKPQAQAKGKASPAK